MYNGHNSCLYLFISIGYHFHIGSRSYLEKFILSITYFSVVKLFVHYGDVITGAMPSQITSFTIVYSTVYSSADQRKHQSSASLAFVCTGNSPVTGEFPAQMASNTEMFPLDDVIIFAQNTTVSMYKISIWFDNWDGGCGRTWFREILLTMKIVTSNQV